MVACLLMEQINNKRNILVICLLLGIITFIAFEQVLHNGFIDYDDGIYVTENQNVQQGLTLNNIYWALTTNDTGNWHPLTWMSLMLDCQLFGLNPSFHHLTNLLLHIANTMLLFAVLYAMTSAFWRSAFVAAIFALHPLHVESVAWAAERKDVLSALFWLLTISAYLRYTKTPGIGRYLLTLLVFALGLMAKPMLVTLPFVLLLLDYWPLNRIENKSLTQSSQKQTIFHLVREKIPFLILSGISSIVTFIVQQGNKAVMPLTEFPLRLRLANAAISYVRYLGKMFLPTDLAIFYPIHTDELTYGLVLISVISLCVASIIVVRFAPAHRYLPVGWFWFLGTLVPVIGIVQVGGQAIADRYSYIPSIGIFIMVAWGSTELLYGWKYRKALLAISASAIIFVLLIVTRTQVSYWQNSISIFEHALSVTKNNAIIHYDLGRVYHLQNNTEKAMQNYIEAIRITPADFESHNNLGMLLRNQNKLDEAIEHFRKAIESAPRFAAAYSNLGRTLLMQGQFDDAITSLNTSLKLEPDRPERWNILADACIKAGKIQEATESAIHACEMTNNSEPRFLDTLSSAYAAGGNFTKAINTAETAQILAQTAGDKELAENIQAHIQLFKQGLSLPK